MSESSTFRVKIIIDSKDQTSAPAKKATKGMSNLKQAAKLAAGAFVAFQAAQKAIEFVKFGAKVQRAQTALNSLAKGAGTSGDAIVKSIQVAADFTIDKMSAMEAANKALLLGVASSPEEFATLTKQAVLLGRAMGQDAAKSIDDFVTAAGRQSKQIADNLGLMVSAEDANLRFAEANNISAAAMTDQQRKAAFLQEMLRQAEEKTKDLGSAQLTTADKIDQATAALKDAGANAASFVATLADSSGVIDATTTWAQSMSTATEAIKESGFSVTAWVAGMGEFISSGGDSAAAMETFAEKQDEVRKALERSSAIWTNTTEQNAELFDLIQGEGVTAWQQYEKHAVLAAASLRGLPPKVEDVTAATIDLGVGTGDFFDVMSEGQSDLSMYEGALGDVTDALLAQESAVVGAARANRETAADFTSLGRDVGKMAADFAKDREEIEAEHQENLAKIAKKGQSTAIRFDAAAETERLSRLKERLQVSLQQQSEFSDKTKVSQLQSKEFSIANLQEEIATREQRLADFHAGRLVKAGINTVGLIAEEQARFDQELAILDESRIEQERVQRESLGRMLLEHVVTWGQMAGATATEIEAMQLKIAEEYGIITEDGVAAATAQKDTWLENFALIRQVGEDAFAAITNRINLIPKTITVDIVFQQRHSAKEAAEAELGFAVPGMAAGGFAGGGTIDVGEEGPERVILPAGSFVNNAAQTSSITNFNQTVNTRATQSNVMADFEMMKALAN